MPNEIVELLRECFQKEPDARPDDMFCVEKRSIAIFKNALGEAYLRSKPNPVELRADSLNNKALTMLDLGRPEQAEVLLEQALAADSQHVDATYNLGLMQWRSGRISDIEVLQGLEHIQRVQPEGGRVACALGWNCLESGRLEGAHKYFMQAAELEPKQYKQ